MPAKTRFRGRAAACALAAGLAVAAPLPAALAAGSQDIAVMAQNNLDREVYVRCEMRKGGNTMSSATNVPQGQKRLVPFMQWFSFTPGQTVTLHCGAFENAAGGRGAPVFPHAGAGGLSPIGVSAPADGQKRVVTYVAKQPAPHYEGVN